MPRFTATPAPRYAPRTMSRAAPLGHGPWGEAIRYWLRRKKLNQAELAELAGIQQTTVSRLARGYHGQTRILDDIARKLEVALEDVLVSPLRRGPADTKRQFLREMINDALRTIDADLDELTLEWAKRLHWASTGRRMAAS